MSDITIEICANSAQDVFRAAEAGAHRVELNGGILLGGLTPSIGSVMAAKKAGIPIFAMLRPREGGFCYTDYEFESMVYDALALTDAGVKGIVFGILNSDSAIDIGRCKKLMDSVNLPFVFHRAIDVTKDWRSAIDALCGLGIKRVLTSGQAKTAIEGATVIREMIEYAAGRIEIMPGGGIRLENAERLLKDTGAKSLHVSMGKWEKDASCGINPEIRFCADTPKNELAYRATDKDEAEKFCMRFKNL